MTPPHGPRRRSAVASRDVAVVAAAAGVAGYLASSLGYLLTLPSSGVVFLWPPSGLFLAVLLIAPGRWWGAILLGSALGNAVADMQHGAGLVVALAGGGVNALEQGLAATVVRRLVGPTVTLATLRQVGALVLGAVVVSNAATALLGALVILNNGGSDFGFAWLSWWTGDGMGMLILAPVVLTQVHFRPWLPRSALKGVEFVALLLAIAGMATLLLFLENEGVGSFGPYAHVVFPLLIWAGLRFGPLGAAGAVLTLATVVTAGAVTGTGVFAAPPGRGVQGFLDIYAYLALAAISALVPAAVLAERRAAETRLAESEGRFRQLAEHIHEAFFLADLEEGRMLYVSPSWARIWGRPLEDAYRSRVWIDTVHPDDQEALGEPRERALAGLPVSTQYRICRPDGAVRWIQARTFPVTDGQGKVYRLAGLTADVTEVKEARERFLQSQKLEVVGRLAGGVVHDFNNVLTVIFSEVDILRLEGPLTAGQEEALSGIRKAAESGAALTRQLLAFSRRSVANPQVLAVDDAVARSARMLQRVTADHVHLVLEPGAPGALVRIDPGHLEQLLLNLVINARDAMPGGGVVTLETSVDGAQHDPRVVLRVRDTGVGIPPEVLHRVFEPFFTTKREGQGTGLGLATCQWIVANADGHIDIESVVQSGTSVQVSLPRVAGSADPAVQLPPSSSPDGGGTVLVVEDDAGVRRSVTRMLRTLGYEVLEARSAEEALTALGQTPVDVVLTDVVLPGIPGHELAERVRQAHPDVGVVFMSGHTEEAFFIRDLVAQGMRLLRKPFSSESLATQIRDVRRT